MGTRLPLYRAEAEVVTAVSSVKAPHQHTVLKDPCSHWGRSYGPRAGLSFQP